MSPIRYRFVPGSRLSGDANRAGQELDEISRSNNGNLTAKLIVSEVMASRSELYIRRYFTADRGKAAMQCWLSEARQLLRGIQVVAVIQKGPDVVHQRIRAFVANTKDKGDYRSIAVVMASRSEREMILEQALRELKWFEKKYSHLTELAEVMKAIKRLPLQRAVA